MREKCLEGYVLFVCRTPIPEIKYIVHRTYATHYTLTEP